MDPSGLNYELYPSEPDDSLKNQLILIPYVTFTLIFKYFKYKMTFKIYLHMCMHVLKYFIHTYVCVCVCT